MKNIGKRFLVIVLSIIMCFNVPLPAVAANATKEITLKRVDGAKKKYSYTAYFSESWFTEPNSEKLARKGLAKTSALMCTATYGYDEKKLFRGTKHKNDTVKMLKKCGFRDVEAKFSKDGREDSHSEEEDWDHAYIYLGYKELYDGTILIAIIINGYSKGKWEWASNFDIGEGNVHAGFDGAANEIRDRISDYFYLHKFNRYETKYWITGHSRGGALTNLVATKLVENGLAPEKKNLYAYGFATPQYTTKVTGEYVKNNQGVIEEAYIINFVAPNDFVPQVAPSAAGWNYGREGYNIEFDYNLVEVMNEYYEDAVGRQNKGFSLEYVHAVLFAFRNMGKSHKDYDEKRYKIIDRDAISTGENAHSAKEYAMYGIGYAMNEKAENKAKGIKVMVSFLCMEAVELNSWLIDGSIMTSWILDSHNMITYLSWLPTWISYSQNGSGSTSGGMLNQVSQTFEDNLEDDPSYTVLQAIYEGIDDIDKRYTQNEENAVDIYDEIVAGTYRTTEMLELVAWALDVNDEYSDYIDSVADTYISMNQTDAEMSIANGTNRAAEHLEIIARILDTSGEYKPYIDTIADRYQEVNDSAENIYQMITNGSYRSAEYLEIIARELDYFGNFSDLIDHTMETGENIDSTTEYADEQFVNGTYRTVELLTIIACELSSGEAYDSIIDSIYDEYEKNDKEAEYLTEQMRNGTYATSALLEIIVVEIAGALYGPQITSL